ncbi:metal ABC transporter permease [Alkaliphilus peptidifermentans]|uniref:Zinc transport system permease protein n=1 Tax=Alkaliphilus peptidifermentans DSM 18978 TaxID=1120976 RepID=A0A1G5JWG2_9FIRM|nr:metal ABC transporter permease [Alkaliphilus peptidifermentans]SCY92713.1 zinc transport system permease protein [Alkaliphilus peptidifermentans DSM 18978]
MSIIEFLQVPIFQRALFAAILAGGTMSLLGIVIVVFNMTTIRFALMHFGLLGGAIGLALGANPLTAAIAAIAIGSLLFGPLSDKLKLDTGLIGAFFMTGSIALAFLLFYKAGVPALDVFSLFTGSILTLSRNDLLFITVLGTVVVLTFVILYKEIQLIFYDSEQAEWLGVPAKRIRNGLLFLTGLSIGVAMKIVGALLIDALILLSAMAAMRLAKNFKQLILLTSLFGMVTTTGGLLLSMVLDLPTGATITLTGVLILLFSTFIQK